MSSDLSGILHLNCPLQALYNIFISRLESGWIKGEKYMYTNQISVDLKSRLTLVRKIIAFCEKQLKESPAGRLRIMNQGNTIYYYHVNGNDKNGKSIDRNDQQLIRSLAQKAYLQSILKKAVEEEKLLSRFVDYYDSDELTEIYRSCSQDRKDLISPVLLPDEEYKAKWQAQTYKHKEIDETLPVYETIKGEHVRSKSEQLIADRLYFAGIPYKYECPIVFGDAVLHPDFTILRMSDRCELYYEHFGKMDDPAYANKNNRRINLYSKNGLILGDRLFITMETSVTPLDIRTVDRLIKSKFI